MSRLPRRTAIAAALLVTAAGVAVGSGPAAAAPPGGPDWIVSVGDSYISGEAGRWAGNSPGLFGSSDALGATAYYDNPGGTAETIERCHRSRSAEIHIGGGINSLNLACSGAETATAYSEGYFKPGLDFYDDGAGNQGQAKMLATFAATNRVRMVVVSIGGNDFGFGPVVKQCVEDFLKPWPWSTKCSTDPSVTGRFSAAAQATQQTAIQAALGNVAQAMTQAGYAPADYTMLVQTYPSPLPPGGGIRYPETYARQSTGGCGLYDADASWANNVALGAISRTVRRAVSASGLTNVAMMELTQTLTGRRLCEAGVATLGEQGSSVSWNDAGVIDRSEWVQAISIINIGATYQQESLHPDYWAQLGLRNCVRQAYNGGNPRGGTCLRGAGGTNGSGEPNMTLAGTLTNPPPVVADDRFVVSGGASFLVSAPGVLANDHDTGAQVAGTGTQLPAEPLSAQLVSPPANGTVTLGADGSFEYTPDEGFAGTDSFSYVAADLYDVTGPTTVTLVVPVVAAPRFTG